MKSRRIIAIALCAGILVSSVNVAFTSSIKDGNLKLNLPFINNFSQKKPIGVVIENNTPDIKELKKIKSKQIIMELPEKNQSVVKGTKESNSKDRKDNNLYCYSQKDIEELLNKGYSITDIIKADEVGNRINEDPTKLLDMKVKSKIEWTAVEKEVELVRKQNYIDIMKKKKPEIYNKLNKEKLSIDDMAYIFSCAERNSAPIDKLIQDYKVKGKNALKVDNSSAKKHIQKSKMEKYGLTEAEIKGLSDEMLEKIEKASVKKGIPVKEFIKKLNSQIPAEGRK